MLKWLTNKQGLGLVAFKSISIRAKIDTEQP